MIVKIWFERSNVPIVYENAQSTYQKGDMFCVGYGRSEKTVGQADKYPIGHIFKVNESEFITSQPYKEKK